MDNNNSQTMQNWKKQIIMDPTLNYLFDTTITPQQFFESRILSLDQPQMVNTYTKLASLKHSVSKNIQKEVESKHQLIENSFSSLNQLHQSFPKSDRSTLQDAQKYLQKFNSKFQMVDVSLQKWKNIVKVVRYASALQSLFVNIKLLKTLLRDSKDTDSKDSTNYLKVSKIIKEIIVVSQTYDFNGVPVYQKEKLFIKNSKDAVYSYAERDLFNTLANPLEFQNQIQEKLNCLFNINKYNQFATNYLKTGLKQIGEILKKLFNSNSLEQFNELCSISFDYKVCIFASSLICLQQFSKKLKINPLNLFDKMWENLTNFIKDILKWKFQQQAKDKQKEREKCLFWKYPIFLEHIEIISNRVHMELITNTKFNFIEFGTKKQQLVITLLNLSKAFYKGINDKWKVSIDELESVGKQKTIELIKILKVVEFLNWIVGRIKNNDILARLLNISKNYIQIIKQKCLKYQITNQFHLFLTQLKNIFTSNPYFQIHNLQIIEPFKLIREINNDIQKLPSEFV